MTGKILQSMKFEHQDIVITDPCYILEDGTDLESVGITDQLTSGTYYGDWSCTVWRASVLKDCIGKNAIGHFCADSGMVCVADIKQVLEYNPELEEWIKKHEWCAAVIKDFTGEVKFVLNCQESLRLYGLTDKKVVWISAQTGC